MDLLSWLRFFQWIVSEEELLVLKLNHNIGIITFSSKRKKKKKKNVKRRRQMPILNSILMERNGSFLGFDCHQNDSLQTSRGI